MKKTHDIAVIGAGSWGTAIANLLSKAGHRVTLWVRSKELLKLMKTLGENPTYLRGYKLDKKIELTSNLRDAFCGREIIAIAIPVPFLRETLTGVEINKESVVVSLSKGIEIETFSTPTEILNGVLHIEADRLAVLSGPNFAKEVAQGLPTATVIAAINKDVARELQSTFATPTFRVYRSTDVKGVEICGAAKNVMAIASGISDGLGLGYNARASLLTRGLAEIIRLGSTLGAKKETFMGLAGIGDLILTATGQLSRNRTVGLKIAEGKDIAEILSNMKMVPEGVTTAKALYSYSQEKDIDLPITKEVYEIIYEKKKPEHALESLMKRPLKEENYLL